MLHFYRLSSPPKLVSKFKTSSSVLSSSYPLGVHVICLNQSSGRPFKGFSTAATAVADKKGSSSTFFADDAVSWNSLGLSDRLSRALENSGFGRPSIVQVSSLPSLLYLLLCLQIYLINNLTSFVDCVIVAIHQQNQSYPLLLFFFSFS